MNLYYKDHIWSAGPVDSNIIATFVAHLTSCKFAPSTIISNVSAVSFVHKISGWSDPANTFLIKKLLTGAKNLCNSVDGRLPITAEILHKLIKAIPLVIESLYIQIALKTMFTLAFFGLLRIAEIATKNFTKNARSLVVQLSDVQLVKKNGGKVLAITLLNFKHNKSRRPVTLELQKQARDICPVTLMGQYLKVRTHKKGPLFVFPDGGPISQLFFGKQLAKVLNASGYSPNKYKGHSFRIGGATAAASSGCSELKIQAMGRWKSGAFRRYIRIPTIQSHTIKC